jgi:hypothetical protein
MAATDPDLLLVAGELIVLGEDDLTTIDPSYVNELKFNQIYLGGLDLNQKKKALEALKEYFPFRKRYLRPIPYSLHYSEAERNLLTEIFQHRYNLLAQELKDAYNREGDTLLVRKTLQHLQNLELLIHTLPPPGGEPEEEMEPPEEIDPRILKLSRDLLLCRKRLRECNQEKANLQRRLNQQTPGNNGAQIAELERRLRECEEQKQQIRNILSSQAGLFNQLVKKTRLQEEQIEGLQERLAAGVAEASTESRNASLQRIREEAAAAVVAARQEGEAEVERVKQEEAIRRAQNIDATQRQSDAALREAVEQVREEQGRIRREQIAQAASEKEAAVREARAAATRDCEERVAAAKEEGARSRNANVSAAEEKLRRALRQADVPSVPVPVPVPAPAASAAAPVPVPVPTPSTSAKRSLRAICYEKISVNPPKSPEGSIRFQNNSPSLAQLKLYPFCLKLDAGIPYDPEDLLQKITNIYNQIKAENKYRAIPLPSAFMYFKELQKVGFSELNPTFPLTITGGRRKTRSAKKRRNHTRKGR